MSLPSDDELAKNSLVVRYSNLTAHVCYVGNGYRAFVYTICGLYKAPNEPDQPATVRRVCKSCLQALWRKYGYECQA
jgi:hypothetical protein